MTIGPAPMIRTVWMSVRFGISASHAQKKALAEGRADQSLFSTAPSQLSFRDRVDERGAASHRLGPRLLEAVVPYCRYICVLNQHQTRVELQAFLLEFDDFPVIAKERRPEGPEEGFDETEPARPIDRLDHFRPVLLTRRTAGEEHHVEISPRHPATDDLEPCAWKLKSDLGRNLCAQELVNRLCRCMPHHNEAGRQWPVELRLLPRSPPPPPMAVHIGSMRGIHQPDHGMVDTAGKHLPFDEARRGRLRHRDARRLALRNGRVWRRGHIDPDQPVLFP